MKKICLFLFLSIIYVTPAFSMTRQELTEVVKRAEQGDPKAQNILGNAYCGDFYCEGLEKDYAKAYELYQKAASQNYAPAYDNLGNMYYYGNYVKQDYSEAMKYYLLAVKQNYQDSIRSIGNLYADGSGVKQDYSEAFKWYLKAAELGDADSQNFVGVMYYNGKGVKKDYNEAFKWYLKAAKQGYHWGQYNVGYCYAEGKGVKQDHTEAMKWYELAAKQGNQDAQKAISAYKQDQAVSLVLGGLVLGGLAYLLSGNDDRATSNNDSYHEHELREEVTKPMIFQCKACHGTGKCSNCNGTGEVLKEEYHWLSGQPYDELQRMPCPVCWRPGVCKQCDGSGKVDRWGNAIDN